MLQDAVPVEMREHYEAQRQAIKARLEHFSEADQRRIRVLAVKLVEGQVANGKIEESDEAIALAMPQALKDAMDTLAAVNEFIS